ncbi:DUF2507 domain-containing protein [Virgibacillus alimentarius]|uniref:Hydrocarbon binding protein n=1 Tax=Virgibacillus alimentarius TaxID=698769 RepID=A0ABS4S5A3_9BACI|nr:MULTISPECIES: DUF2507 domain-containing protein [Virgibacillus]MBP2256677.1 putative hydrocarbon binding protein [Virgibacillus alimentarius]HLR67139.1 DUF2507 domain-containing protein [Virgibacillus sp.]
MSKKQQKIPISLLDDLHTSGAGYDILRYISLPELLGTESKTLLYFIGRNLARKLDITSLEDIYDIYEKLGWGKIELVKEKKRELIFHLMDDAIVYRLKSPLNSEFRLEAGFLAEAIQIIKGNECECIEKVNHKIYQIEFTVVYTK